MCVSLDHNHKRCVCALTGGNNCNFLLLLLLPPPPPPLAAAQKTFSMHLFGKSCLSIDFAGCCHKKKSEKELAAAQASTIKRPAVVYSAELISQYNLYAFNATNPFNLP